MVNNIPYGRQWIDEDDISAVAKVLQSDWLTQGPDIEEFEKEIAEYVGAKYAVAFSSGTSALHGAMFAAGIGPGDEIITSPITFVATSNSAIYLGARPRFVDIDLKTYCIDTAKIEEAITPNTKVIAPVDLAGYPVNIETIMGIARRHNVVVVEDSAHALGAKRNGKMVGTGADMSLFSFHPVKHITTGEGGAITTDNEEFYKKMKIFVTHGITKDPALLQRNDGPWYYEMQELGFNYRLTDFQCALGLSQLKKIEGFLDRRNEIASMYNEAFKDIEGLVMPPKPEQYSSRHAYHLYPILVTKTDRKEAYIKLREMGIFAQVHYIPVHLQPYYRNNYGFKKGDYPNAEYYYEHELSIPMYPKMKNEEVNYVIQSIKSLTK
ncbi:aminotransferase DegT [Mesotoga sp. Brook.08.YT.4.2.5.1]|uniref:UDP-4-amino-4, 6-dideoxy-N-acetyl-beta-L-altrosamine transaminase n=1 Tax=unclassified Mesotoga TaxID=1184398 RepID=UPI000CC37869|nr:MULTISPECIES: UDP-4-amino-4,6-dideoxy-N-acetyl-beta-L-altrosamine transaminase [unclassified Mesotoga]PNE20160.1 aminotransferase DegT [Mesotoga sp. Brook.08.YT.4.2.5.1]PNS40772.1 aminotransferase DegT [Mesotoga sp. B105.6.4]RDI93296.1 aminotransferase DegT [Mesotoga sp. Brook.08.YT.4.2.5.2.]